MNEYITEEDDFSLFEGFAHKNTISPYVQTATASMVKAEIISGSDVRINPLKMQHVLKLRLYVLNFLI